ncbi:MAG: PorV/PorQ family protein [Candidatus Latescibacterota bacterium]|nr:MAG: PorV/PorQ family protein [Candidatus Latescibacterota bacterium]
MIRRCLPILIALAAFSRPLVAMAQSYGTELPFVVGTSARAAGLGTAGTTLRDDASVQYYNPSGLSYLEWKQFSFFRTTLFDSDTHYLTFSYAHPLLNYGTIGVSVLRLSVGGIEERNDNNQLLSEDLHNTQTRILLGYANNITSSIAGGFNLKIDRHSFGSFSGSGIGLDVGISATQHTKAHSFIRGFRQGFVMQNLIEPSVKLDQEKVADPMQIAFGASMLSSFKGANLETFVDLVRPRFSPFRIQIGQEITYADHFSVRLGLDDQSVAYGLGASYKNVAFDYAYRSVDIGGNHRFSLSVRFGSSIPEKRANARAALEREVNNKIIQGMDELERAQINSALQTGDSLFALEKYEEALTHYESTLLWDPQNEHAEESLTKCRYHQLMNQSNDAVSDDDYVLGLLYAKQALDIVPGDPDAQAQADFCQAKLQEAENRTELVDDLLKTSIELYAEREYGRALAGFDEVLILDPPNELAGEYRRKCVAHIEEFVRTSIRDARRLATQGDYDGASDLLAKAGLLKPDDPRIPVEIAKLEKLRTAEAVARQKPAVPTPKPVEVKRPPVDAEELENKYDRGMEYFNDGNFRRAVELFTDVWSADPSFHDVSNILTRAYLFIGIRLYSEDNYSEAMEIWKKVLSIDPQNAKAKRYLRKTADEIKKVESVYDD